MNMPFGIQFDSGTMFLLMGGNLVLGYRSYRLLRSATTRKAMDIYWRISVVTHIVGSILFIIIGNLMSGNLHL